LYTKPIYKNQRTKRREVNQV